MFRGIFRTKPLSAILQSAEEGQGFGTLRRSLGWFQLLGIGAVIGAGPARPGGRA